MVPTSRNNKRVELEGGEAVSQGFLSPSQQVSGPSHSNGGVPADLDVGAMVFSKKVKRDGVSMAKHKEKRDNYLKKLTKMAKDRPNDPIVRNTVKRALQVEAEQEMDDLILQETESMKKMKDPKKKAKYMYGTGPSGVPGQLDENGVPLAGQLGQRFLQNFITPSLPGTPLTTTGVVSDGGRIASQLPQANFLPDLAEDNLQAKIGEYGISQPQDNGVAGAAAGIGGAALNAVVPGLGAILPTALTLVNRAGDLKQQNFQEQVSERAEATIRNQGGASRAALLEGLMDQIGQGQTAAVRAAGNSRSRGTQVAQQQVANANAARQRRQAVSEGLSSENQAAGQLANLQLQGDNISAAGSERAQIRTEQDRDAFFTNLSSNTAAATQNLQNMRRKPITINLMDILSK